MNFQWTEQQQNLWDEMRAFADMVLNDEALAERDRIGIFAENLWQVAAKQGVFGLNMPAAYGGQAYDTLSTVRALEAIGYGCPDNGLTLNLNAQIWTVQKPLLQFGTPDQKDRYLPGLVRGEIKGAQAITEADAGSDAFSLKTIAQKVPGGYRISGEKMLIGLAPIADFIILFATTNPDLGSWGVTAFLVDTSAEGFSVSPNIEKMGLRTDPTSNVCLQDVFVSDTQVLGKVGTGASIFNASATLERAFIFSSHVGAMARQLDDTIAFVKGREQGGQSIGKYQSVSNRVADMKLRLESARMHLYRAAYTDDQNQDLTLESAMVKLLVSESFVQNSIDAMRIHGGRGYISEFGVERDVRDALGGVIYGGTSDIQRNLIARMLGI